MEAYFQKFRKHIIGLNQTFRSPYTENQPILYADWIASGRLYQPIEERLMTEVYPFVANTHTETSITGMGMTIAYHEALNTIRKHVNASEEDVVISSNSGMTGVVNKFQRILGLKIHENHQARIKIADEERPIVFVTHMEHHSNQISWYETIAEVVVIEPDKQGLVCLDHFQQLLHEYRDRPIKIAAITACSNVTGIETPYHKMARMVHTAGGLCFVDFACSAPYVDMNMHPEAAEERLDAIFFSPHKFLGGPGSTGILVFNKNLYHNSIPDNPGGGTVDWTNPWGGRKYVDGIESREDGGTPAFLQTIRAAFAIRLKEEMGVENILKREHEQLDIFWKYLDRVDNLHILADHIRERLGVVSFYIDGLHYNLGVKMLNDRFGIQVRGGCSCAGTYGHYLLHVEPAYSRHITDLINAGDYSEKPGWIRLSLHPTMTDAEVHYLGQCVRDLAANFEVWSADYQLDFAKNYIACNNQAEDQYIQEKIDSWFSLSLS